MGAYRLTPAFFVIDENGIQIESVEFSTYGPAEKRARQISKERKIKTSVGVCVPPTMYLNGRVTA